MTDPEVPGDPASQGERDDRPEIDIDSAFAAIVAGFSDPVPHGVGPWPASEDLDDDPDDPGATAQAALPGVPATPDPSRWELPARHVVLPGGVEPVPRSGRHAGPAEDDDEDEGYQPPEPPPLPRGDLVSRLAWTAVLGGPVFLLLAALLWRSLPTVLLLVALTAFVGGFVTLVARMPQEHPDDPDDGAVV